ncbi:hypothetical protein FVE85_0631 [Porphyridium purpureum]|uniref:MARVEL domain-containing protein n=1 Tax=Porphyridium purpureum TaxID=35688 RepID=A0A5J4Z185_PORPP|nr:hypothetical protein FVE85_0631 [Porphyridium purpureum]|eukprot:POR5653..scf208_2
MGLFEFAKIGFYFLEWIWALVVFALTADKLYFNGLCAFGSVSVCQYIIAAGVIGWLLISVLFIGHSILGMMGKAVISASIEFFVNLFLLLWWLILAIVVSAEKDFSTTDVNTIVAFSWMLVIFTICSAALAFLTRNKSDSMDDMPPPSSMDI